MLTSVVLLVAGLFVAYIVLAPVVLAVAIGLLAKAGLVDWSGARRPAPSDPVEIGYRGDPMTAFGHAFETVTYQTELGPAEAWVIPADGEVRTWAIWVHGVGGIRENGYRLLQHLHDAGLPVLMITYRNDKGAPRSADGLHSFGLTEWPDLAAAVEWTRAHGAERVVVAAESMGAGITGQYLMRADNTAVVAGLALDAPALDFPAVIHAGGARYRVPMAGYVANAGLWLSSLMRRDLREAVCLEAVARFRGPIFVSHGRRDPLVPFSISARLAEMRPDMVLHSPDADEHPQSYKADPVGYAEAFRGWIEAVKAAP